MVERCSIPHALRDAAAVVAYLACWLVALSLLSAFIRPAITGALSGNPALMRFALELLSLVSVVAPTVLFAHLPPVARRGASRAGAPVAVLFGSAMGLAWLAAALGANCLAGTLSLGAAAPVPHLAIWLAACLANAAFQELLVRGYAFDALRASLGAIPAALVTTALFVAFHPGAFADGPAAVLQMAAASLLLTELRLLTGGLAASTAAHFAWNAAGGIGLGVVALADDYPHALSLSVGGGASLSAGAMGIEGSPWTLLVTAAICVALALKLQKSGGA